MATVAILVHVVGVAGIDETPLAREKRGRRFRPAASSVGGVVGDALGRQKRGVESVSVDMKDKKLTLIGDIDLVQVVAKFLSH
ncbi:hypothetical protein LR48_Vigan04g118500 [Vigna angularis]|uniref:HMA domain-containing protein n=1 Tax=Phaseolus angularis TaxID=3914 RepID=A0A0L9UEM9_PHAAN|nr:hypothetical protein LR48_Vigan04g118500 [Vigna angularis]